MMEWGGRQQLILLWQSIVFGVVLGALFSLVNVLSRVSPRKRGWVLVSDVIFFAFCSLATFFFALARMDGHLHPLLFLGSAFGFLLFYFTLGRYVTRGLSAVVKTVRKGLVLLLRLLAYPLRMLVQYFVRFFDRFKKRVRNVEKNKKNINIFSKNT